MSYQDLIPLILIEIVGDFGYKEFANKGGLKILWLELWDILELYII